MKRVWYGNLNFENPNFTFFLLLISYGYTVTPFISLYYT